MTIFLKGKISKLADWYLNNIYQSHFTWISNNINTESINKILSYSRYYELVLFSCEIWRDLRFQVGLMMPIKLNICFLLKIFICLNQMLKDKLMEKEDIKDILDHNVFAMELFNINLPLSNLVTLLEYFLTIVLKNLLEKGLKGIHILFFCLNNRY